MTDESVYIVYIEISVISNVLTLTNIWKACRKRLNWHTHFQDKSLRHFQPSSELSRHFLSTQQQPLSGDEPCYDGNQAQQ